MGLKVPIPGVTFTETNPILQVDQILTEGPGSLILVDFSHPVTLDTLALNTAPVHGLGVPNLATAQAAETVGDGDATTLRVGLTISMDAATGHMERSTKGGMYGVISQVNDSSGNRASMGFPTLIRDYVEANPTHDYFFSLWGSVQRIARNTTSGGLTAYPLGGLKSAGSTSEKEWMTIRELRVGSGTIGSSPTGTERSGFLNASPPVTSFRANVAVNSRISTWSGESLESRTTQWGPYGSSYVHDSPSWVLWRMYFEDLTASGRNYVDVNAIDESLYTRHALTSGGRYYGDTVTTNPISFP